MLRYIDRYENCTYVDGNLEITWLEHGSYNLSFLSSIQEVTSLVIYVLIPFYVCVCKLCESWEVNRPIAWCTNPYHVVSHVR